MVASNRKPAIGRRKIEIKAITNENARQVCFSKRRSGFFKKANELSILCGVEVAALAVSGAGKLFSFANPEIDSFINRFTEDHQQPSSSSSSTADNNWVGEASNRLVELNSLIEEEKSRQTKITLHHEIIATVFDGVNMDGLGANELKFYKEAAMDSRNQIRPNH